MDRRKWLIAILGCCIVGSLFFYNGNTDGKTKSGKTEEVLYEEAAYEAVEEEPVYGESAGNLTEADFDQDGISNEVEIEAGINPEKKDSDKDGLDDGEEIHVHGTDPASYDADGDGLSDGDEIILGLDPLKECTDGTTPDSDRTFEQELSRDKISDKLLAEDNEAVPALNVTISGNVNKKVSLYETASAMFTESEAIVGEAVEVHGSEITEGTLTFALQEDAEREVADGNTKIICAYGEDGITEYLETDYDEQTNRLSAEIKGEGTYFVLDVKTLISELGAVSNAKAATPADVVFVMDTTGSMREEINHVKDTVGGFVDSLNEKGISVNLGLVTYQDLLYDGEASTVVHKNGESNWFSDVEAYKEVLAKLPLGRGGDLQESALDALETARLLDLRVSAGKVFILVSDAPYRTENRYGIPSMEAEIELLKNAQVSCSVVGAAADKETYRALYEETGGTWMDIEGEFQEGLMSLAEQLGETLTGEGHWIYLQGPVPVPVRLDAKPQEGSLVDTDKDGISDVKELGSATPSGTIDLDELLTKASKGVITGTNYGTVEMYSFVSNPGETDTDFDGTKDSEDTSPNNSHGTGVMRYSIDGSSYNLNIEFDMDYRNLITGSNTAFTRNLSMLSVLLATDVYDTAYIEVQDFAKTGGSETETNFGDLLGMEDSRYVAVKGYDYSVDKDDITDFYIGHKNIVYDGKAHEIIVVSVRGTDGTNEEWSSNFDIGADTTEYYRATGSSHPHWVNKEHHKGFDVAANRALAKINAYVEQFVNPYAEKSILITGHSRGAAIANILGKHFEDQSDYRAYTYTFATPNTTTASNAASYQTIFNVNNTDDIIPFMPLEQWGFKKYGVSKNICVEDYYENELGAAEEGSWEWFMGGTDYDNDYNTQNTLNQIKKIVSKREDFYVLGTTDSEKVWEDDLGHTTQAGANEELANLTAVLEQEKLLKFCNMYIVKDWFIYHVEINYCPAYLLQTLANMTTGVGPLLGRDVAGVYADAKTAFVASSGKVVIGGMTHPHMPPTYYIMTYHDLKSLY